MTRNGSLVVVKHCSLHAVSPHICFIVFCTQWAVGLQPTRLSNGMGEKKLVRYLTSQTSDTLSGERCGVSDGCSSGRDGTADSKTWVSTAG